MSEPKKTLYLLDAYALIYRAHFAFSNNPRITSKGINSSVPFGFTNTMLEVLQKREPTHIGVVFDTSAPTFRHKIFKEYKAHRQETPEDVRAGIPIVKDIVKAFNIPVMELDGYEADDIIGTLAKQAATKGFEVYMMTPDKDFSQLVDEHIFLYKPAYMGNAVDILGIEEIKEKWQIDRVDQVRDILGLQGDAADNIPGIPGVGAKTAVKFIKEYGSVEGLIANVEQLKGKMKENVEQFAEQGILSKELATINLEVPVEFNEEELVYTGPNEESLKAIFKELEFRTLINRVFADKVATPGAGSGQISLFDQPQKETAEEVEEVKSGDISSAKSHYQLMDSPELRKRLIQFLKLQESFVMKIVTMGLDPIDDDLLGLTFSYYKGDAYFVPVSSDPNEIRSILHEFKAVLENENIAKIGHNLKFDFITLRKYDIKVQGPIFDLMIVHYLIDPETSHALDVLSDNYLGYSLITLESLSETGKKPTSLREVDTVKLTDFSCEQADIILKLKPLLEEQIKDKKLKKLLNEVELPLLRVLENMEFSGVRIEVNTLKTMSSEIGVDILRIQQKIHEIAGEEFNIGSPKQLGDILFEKMHLIEKPKKTKSGQYATGEEILSKLASEHDIVQKILDYREFLKLKNTYLDALPEMISPWDQRIHTNYSQAVAATGRLSSVNPNLQNIPIRTEKGRAVRRAFIPSDKNFKILSADYSQIELRIMADFSKDENMMNAFIHQRDIHAITASKIFKVPLESVDSNMRRMAKSANFGMIYGISAFGLSQNLNIPRKEAVEIIENYFNEFKAVKRYMDNAINEAREKEYVETILGRKRYLRDINSRNATTRGYAERNAINAPIQGSAADMIKVAMVNIHAWMEKEKLTSRMIMQVHDELVFEAHIDEIDLLGENVIKLMQSAIKLEVPIEVETGVGDNWLEAH